MSIGYQRLNEQLRQLDVSEGPEILASFQFTIWCMMNTSIHQRQAPSYPSPGKIYAHLLLISHGSTDRGINGFKSSNNNAPYGQDFSEADAAAQTATKRV